ncbi:radical SAM domain protein [Chromatium okenii]|uniref:radical SAM/SPASM domain-containing protein n=1 Tax=Chromatium okenii TaxID=61644 RepID=UPI0019085E6B|nr:radical SAM/SPASM domain-containing protein [Chromatium okenii]MBK1642916.1 radical SAM domain protein [Chromatium okenii]
MPRPDSGNALVFKPTRACPARCDFCCDPLETSHERLHRAEMLDMVEQIAKALPGLIGTVGFTGGEPFLLFDDVLAVLERAAVHGMTGAVVSSSHWAHDADTAQQRLSALAAVGLRRYSTSCDHEHLRFVPLERIRYAVSAALELDLFVTVTGTFSQPGEQVAALLGADLAEQVLCEDKLIAPFGRATGQMATVRHYGLEADLAQWGCYRRLGHDILVQPNGDVLPCCSTNNTINPLVFGNVRQGDDLAAIVRAITGSFLLRVLKFESFALLRELVERHVPKLVWPDPALASGPCGYCAEVFSDPHRTAVILDALVCEQPAYMRQLAIKAGLPEETLFALANH